MHHLFLGKMRHGKTSGAIEIGVELKKLGENIAVFTVAGLDGTPKDLGRWLKITRREFIFTDRQKFLAFLKIKGLWRWHIFVDESNQTVGTHDKEMEASATNASANAITYYFIAQRGQTFNRTVREQCSSLTLFRLGRKDCVDLADDWGLDFIAERGPLLKKFEYLHCTTELGSERMGVTKP